MNKKNIRITIFNYALICISLIIFCGCDFDKETINEYTVTFDLNGGNGTPPPPQTVYVGNQSVTLPDGSEFFMDKFSFGGWNTKPDGTGSNFSAGTILILTFDITLYAKWEIPTVTFDLNLGNGTVPESQTADRGSSIKLPNGEGITRNGYIFEGWNTRASGSGTNYLGGSTYILNNSVTLYAKWNAVYTVTYTASYDGTGTPPASHTVTPGTTIYLRANTFTNTNGLRFKGWYSPQVTVIGSANKILQPGAAVTVYGNITFSAQWGL